MRKLVKTIFKNTVFWYQWNDEFVGQRIALGKYEPYLTKLILGKIKPESVVVDVGANMGITVCWQERWQRRYMRLSRRRRTS